MAWDKIMVQLTQIASVIFPVIEGALEMITWSLGLISSALDSWLGPVIKWGAILTVGILALSKIVPLVLGIKTALSGMALSAAGTFNEIQTSGLKNYLKDIGKGASKAGKSFLGLGKNISDSVGKKSAPIDTSGVMNRYKKSPLGRKTAIDPDTPKDANKMGKFTDSLSKIKPAQLLALGAALMMVAGAVWIFAKAMQEMSEVENLGSSVAAGLAFMAVGLIGIGAAAYALTATGAAFAIMVVGAAMLMVASSVWIFAKAMQELSKVDFKNLASVFTTLAFGILEIGTAGFSAAPGIIALGLAGLVATPGLLGLSLALMALGTSLTVVAGALEVMSKIPGVSSLLTSIFGSDEVKTIAKPENITNKVEIETKKQKISTDITPELSPSAVNDKGNIVVADTTTKQTNVQNVNSENITTTENKSEAINEYKLVADQNNELLMKKLDELITVMSRMQVTMDGKKVAQILSTYNNHPVLGTNV